MAVFWTPEEDAILRAINARDLSPQYRTAAYRAQLPGRTTAAINNRTQKLGVPVRKQRPQRAWTAEEITKLKEEWRSKKTVTQLAEELNRSESSCLNRAKKLGLRTRNPWQKVTITPVLDAAIRAGYASTQRGICQRLADQFGVSPGWVKMRARELGLTRSQGYMAKWTAEEDAMLETLMERGGIKFIQTRMKKAGYHRSLSAIQQRAYQIGLSWANMRDAMNATEFANVMGVDCKVVVGWIRRGMLKGHKEAKSGFHDQEDAKNWLIETKQIRKFLIQHVSSYKLALVDRLWYVSMLAGDDAKINIQHSAGKSSELAGGYVEHDVRVRPEAVPPKAIQQQPVEARYAYQT